MGYTKTNWTTTTPRSISNLNKMQTQYSEAVSEGINIRGYNSVHLSIEEVTFLPAAGSVGRIVYYPQNGSIYVDTGIYWSRVVRRIY
jgi:hypothetical protein